MLLCAVYFDKYLMEISLVQQICLALVLFTLQTKNNVFFLQKIESNKIEKNETNLSESLLIVLHQC